MSSTTSTTGGGATVPNSEKEEASAAVIVENDIEVPHDHPTAPLPPISQPQSTRSTVRRIVQRRRRVSDQPSTSTIILDTENKQELHFTLGSKSIDLKGRRSAAFSPFHLSHERCFPTPCSCASLTPLHFQSFTMIIFTMI